MLASNNGNLSIDLLIAYAQECLHDIPSASKMNASYAFRNRFTHSIRVMKWCERLLEEIPADRNSVIPAAILHDIGYAISAADHAKQGAIMAHGFLTNQDCSPMLADSISELIANHSTKNLDPLKMSNELMILQDADCLDEIGALTVFWDCMAEGACEIQNYRKAYERLLASHKKITGRNRKMKTSLANQIYQERLSVLRQFLDEIEYELFITE